FLIEGSQGTIIHTGDFRAEPWFLESMSRNPFLQPYLAPHSSITKPLEAIYLDTASVLSTLCVPSKSQEKATSGLVELMRLIPESAYFFINSWTWGYEDVLKAISREFGSLIHVDRYKYSVYQHNSDPFLRAITTQDPSSTRFHACERFSRCEHVAVDDEPGESQYNSTSRLGKRVVYINPVNMGSQSWELYIKDTKVRLSRGEEVNNLLVPLSRHSPLNELRQFVALFQPRRIIPNTLDPRLLGFDWLAIERMFADCLHPDPAGGTAGIPPAELDITCAVKQDLTSEDVAFKNLVGEGAADVAKRWAENSHLKKKLEILSAYLDPVEAERAAQVFGLPRHSAEVAADNSTVLSPHKSKGKGKQRAVDSEDETDNGWSDDERGKTAHRLFAGLAGIEGAKQHEWWVSSSPAPSHADELPVLSQIGKKKPSSLAGPSVPWISRLTPVSSPVRAKRGNTRPLPAPRNFTPTKRRTRALDKSPPQTPRPHPHGTTSKVRVYETKGHSLASPICLSSSPAAMPEFLVRVAARSKSHATPSSALTPPRSRPVQLKPPIPQETIPPISTLPPSSPPSYAPSSPLLDVNNRKLLNASPTNAIQKGPAYEQRKGENTATSCAHTGTTRRAAALGTPSPSTPSKRRRLTSPKAANIQAVNNSARLTLRASSPSPRTPKRKGASSQLQSQPRAHLNVQRLSIAERLAQARPDLVVPSYSAKRNRLLARSSSKIESVAKSSGTAPSSSRLMGTPIALQAEATLLSFETVDDDDGGMDWNRSRRLAEALREDVRNGKRPMLPPLLCAESQSQSQSQDV
ncbi:hypothetical protein H0H81_002013, partial [Sphagnurus paluster]